MTINEFLITLEEELKYLPKKKRTVIVNIYREKINTEIDLGTDEDKIADMFPSPSKIAADIYEKEGIDYLSRRKKKLKSDDIFRMIICSFAMLLTISSAIVLTGYLGFGFYKLIYLVTLMDNVKDVIFMLLLAIGLILTLIIVYLYLIDIFILIFNFLLDVILRPFNKTLHFKEFSIIDTLELKLKKEKVFKKLLIAFSITTLLIGAFSYCLQTYFYRSYNQEVPTKNEQIIDLSQYQTLNALKFQVDEADVYVKIGSSFTISVKSEFKKNVGIEVENDILNITTDKVKTFDIFNFLKEPKPIYEITIPTQMRLSFVQDNGILQVENINSNYLYVKMYQGNLILKDSNINEGIIKSSNCGINILNMNINTLDLDASAGTINMENYTSLNTTINDISTDIQVENANMGNLNITTSKGDLTVDNIICNNINVEAGTGEIEFVNVDSTNKIYIVTASSANITLGKAKAALTEITALNGDVVLHQVSSKSIIKTGATALINKCSGEYDITCLGNFLTIQECQFTNAVINAQKTEVSMKFINADYLEYNGNNSMSTLYFIFGREMKIEDPSGDLHLDNDSVIITDDNDLKLYVQYYTKIEKLTISPNASYRVEDGTKLGE